MGRAQRPTLEVSRSQRPRLVARPSRSVMSLAKIQGWPEATRAAAFRFTRTSFMEC